MVNTRTYQKINLKIDHRILSVCIIICANLSHNQNRDINVCVPTRFSNFLYYGYDSLRINTSVWLLHQQN